MNRCAKGYNQVFPLYKIKSNSTAMRLVKDHFIEYFFSETKQTLDTRTKGYLPLSSPICQKTALYTVWTFFLCHLSKFRWPIPICFHQPSSVGAPQVGPNMPKCQIFKYLLYSHTYEEKTVALLWCPSNPPPKLSNHGSWVRG